MTDPDGKVTNYHYDSNGYRDEVKDPLGNVTATVHNAVGWVTATYTPKASCTWNSSPPTGCSSTYKTTYSYVIPNTTNTNQFGDVQTVTDPLSHVTTYGYDADRNRTSVQDANGNTTTYVFDLANEQTQTKRADTPQTSLITHYNDDGTIQDQVDGKSNTIQAYGYDSLARLTTVTVDPGLSPHLNQTTTYTYDGAGNKLTQLDPVTGATCTGSPKVGCTTMTYDTSNELKTVTYSDGVTPNVTSVTYDGDGQRTGMTDGTGTSTWAYDSLHRLTSYQNGNGATVNYGYTYGGGSSYDLKNQVRSIAYPNSVGTVTRAWDDAGRLSSVTDWNSKTTSFSYDANSNFTGETVPSTATVTDTFAFNVADQMTSASASNGLSLFSATYTRDSNGQLATDSSVPATSGAYKYTPLNQLCYGGTTTTSACSSPPVGSTAYGFDAADNLTTNNGNTQAFNTANELCWTVTGASSNACGSAPTGATTYSYDTRDNQTGHVPAVGSATCDGYDQANRLTKVQTGTGSSCTTPTTVGTYAYDGTGLRESKTVSGTTTQYLWDQSGGLPLLLEEKAGSASPTDYISGPGGLPVEPITGSTTYWLHHDQLGSTRLMTDSTGLSAATFTYDPYGNLTASTGTAMTSLMFTGQYKDSESGLYYLRARYYDPTTAQFLSRDPAVAKTRAPYSYAMGSPLNNTDPSGMFCLEFWNKEKCDNTLTETGVALNKWESPDPGHDYKVTNYGIGPVAFNVTITRDGSTYFGAGFGPSKPIVGASQANGDIMASWGNKACLSDSQVNSFVNGGGVNLSAYTVPGGPGGGINVSSIDNEHLDYAIESGSGSPQVGAQVQINFDWIK